MKAKQKLASSSASDGLTKKLQKNISEAIDTISTFELDIDSPTNYVKEKISANLTNYDHNYPFQKSGKKTTMVKYRKRLFELRQNFITKSTVLNLLGFVVIMCIAEFEIQTALGLDLKRINYDAGKTTSTRDDNLYLNLTDASESVPEIKPTVASTIYSNPIKSCLNINNYLYTLYSHTENHNFFWIQALNVLLLVLNFFQIYITFNAYKVEVELFKYDNKIPPDVLFVTNRTILTFLFEVIIYLFIPLNFSNFQISEKTHISFNFFVTPILYYTAILRLPFLFRYIAVKTVSFDKNVPLTSMMKLMEINRGTMILESWRLVWRKASNRLITGSVVGVWITTAWFIRLSEARFAVMTCVYYIQSVYTINLEVIRQFYIIQILKNSLGKNKPCIT